MQMLVFLFGWILGGGISSRFGPSLCIGLLFALIYRQDRKIAELDSKLKTLGHSTKPSADPIKVSTSAALDPDPIFPQVSPKPAIPVEPIAHPPPQPKIPAQVPSSTFRAPKPEISRAFEEALGPTIAGFIIGGNPIARIGVVILFLGVAFALKLVADQGFFPIELRLLTAVVFACGLGILGWKIRAKRPQFGAILLGAGVGIFYITTFIAYRLYHLIPSSLAFGLFVAATVVCGVLAVVQNARSLGALGILAGFLSPVLISEGITNHFILFSYLTILNLGILAVCYFKAWRGLALMGFFSTFFLASYWGTHLYSPELFATCEPFLILLVLLYTATTVLFSLRDNAKGESSDSIMIVSTPFFAALLQYGMVKSFEYGMAWSAAGGGIFYLGLALYLFRKYPAKLKMVVETYYSISISLLSLAIPLAFSGHLTSAIWALEALALIWSGVRQNHQITRMFGIILLGGSSFFFLTDRATSAEHLLFLNPHYLGIAILTASNILGGRLLCSGEKSVVTEDEKFLGGIFLNLGAIWLLVGSYFEIVVRSNIWGSAWADNTQNYWKLSLTAMNAYLIFMSGAVLALWALIRRWKLDQVPWLRTILVVAHISYFTWLVGNLSLFAPFISIHPFISIGYLSWPIMFIAQYFILYREERDAPPRFQKSHIGLLWLLTIIATWEIGWVVSRNVDGSDSWTYAALTIVPAAMLWMVSDGMRRGTRWPFNRNAETYGQALYGIFAWLFFWPALLDITCSGDALPLPYLPVLNPLDIAQGIAFFAMLIGWKNLKSAGVVSPLATTHRLAALSTWCFLWATVILLRSVHHYFHIPWEASSLWDSSTAQAALSIFWSILALGFMWFAHRKNLRVVWQAGAILIGLVVVKLFLVDLSNQGTLARIIVFLGVGLLMLLMGYVAPIPPLKPETDIRKID